MRHYRTTSHSKYDLKVHLVWVPKYRKKILYGQVGEKVRDLIRQICQEEDVEIISGKVAIDHVHLFASYPPHLSISKLMQKIKGESPYKLFSLFPSVRKTFWGRHFWARGYLAVSSGAITDEMIKEYIDNQEGEELQHGTVDIQ
ncbi:MAG: IS200/IS605 family transposase [Patescibacteria group bacterium]